MGQGMSRLSAIRQIGVVEQTYYRWRNQYGGMGVDQLKELNRLQKENDQLRRAVSDLTLDKLILKEAVRGNLLSPARRRACINHVRSQFKVSERRACRVLGQHRSTQRHIPKGRADEDRLCCVLNSSQAAPNNPSLPGHHSCCYVGIRTILWSSTLFSMRSC